MVGNLFFQDVEGLPDIASPKAYFLGCFLVPEILSALTVKRKPPILADFSPILANL